MEEQKVLLENENQITPELLKQIEDLPPYLYQSIKDRIDKIPVSVLDALVHKRALTRQEMIRYQIPFNRHQMRLIALECLYQHLLLGTDIKKCLYNALLGSNQVDEFLYNLTIDTVNNEEIFKDQISKYLRKDWDFDRLSLLEQAILLMAMEEIQVNDEAKPVVINEAITLAKQYCDDQSFKMINAVLDRI